MKPNAIFVLDKDSYDLIYGPDERREIAQLVNLYSPMQTSKQVLDNPSILGQADMLLSGWGCPRLDKSLLDFAPNLKAIFYGAGAMGYLLTPEVWARRIHVTSAISANSIPVAEFTLGTILLSLKHAWRLANQSRIERTFVDRNAAPGAYRSTVGLISMGTIARELVKLLKPFDLKVLVYDPFLGRDEADSMGVDLADLPTLFRKSDVVSLHTPLLTETIGMIGKEHFAVMKSGATFINTARGPIVRELEMIETASRRPDLQFVLDVTSPEPPLPTSPLYTLSNIFLTPHIAGSVGNECRRMGSYMVEELKRYLKGQPLKWEVRQDQTAHSSHRPQGAASVTEKLLKVSQVV